MSRAAISFILQSNGKPRSAPGPVPSHSNVTEAPLIVMPLLTK